MFLELSQNSQENTFLIEHLRWLLLILAKNSIIWRLREDRILTPVLDF